MFVQPCSTAFSSYSRLYSALMLEDMSSSGSSSYSIAIAPATPPMLMSPDTAPEFVEAHILPSRTSSMSMPDVSVSMSPSDVPMENIASNIVFDSSLNFSFTARISFATAPLAPAIAPLSMVICPPMAEIAAVRLLRSGVTMMSFPPPLMSGRSMLPEPGSKPMSGREPVSPPVSPPPLPMVMLMLPAALMALPT